MKKHLLGAIAFSHEGDSFFAPIRRMSKAGKEETEIFASSSFKIKNWPHKEGKSASEFFVSNIEVKSGNHNLSDPLRQSADWKKGHHSKRGLFLTSSLC